ncbi:MAG: hypothetical protein QF454_05485 [Candidatus Thalassarchaeaceae archaeon]|jgi:hypothetical protein|nr:hypothetical protein [Candidatus Thalassarchaeaceae archaeon]
MLKRLLTNLDDVEACLQSGEGDVIGGDGEGNIAIFHQAMKMATNLQIGPVEEIWFEGESTLVASTIRGGSCLWLASDSLPVGRLSHEARSLRPVIEDLIEV